MCPAWVGVGEIREVQLVARGAQQGCTALALPPPQGQSFLGVTLTHTVCSCPRSFPPTRKEEGGTKLPMCGVDCWGLSQASPRSPAGGH